MSSMVSVNKKNKKKVFLEVLSIGSIGLCLSGIASPIIFQFFIPLLTFFFMRSVWEMLLFLGIVALHGLISVENLILLGIYFMAFQVLVFVTKAFKGSVLKMLQVFQPLMAAVFVYYFTQDFRISAAIFFIQFILFHSIHENLNWMRNEFQIPSAIYGLLFLMLGCFLYMTMPMYQALFIAVMFIFICVCTTPLTAFLCYFLVQCFFVDVLPLSLFMALFFMSLLKKQPKIMVMLTIVLMLSLPYNLENLLSYGLYLVLFLLLSKEGTPFMSQQLMIEHNQKATMNRQLTNFAYIFEDMSNYFKALSPLESTMLENMSLALGYTAKKCLKEGYEQLELKQQVSDILDGYKIEFDEIGIEEHADGLLSLKLSLYHFRKSEVLDTLLPLLNHILPTQVELSSQQTHQHLLGLTTYTFLSVSPLHIDAYADSIKHENICGDSFSVFSYMRNVYCMISDGMGCGDEANKISHCISNIFQRMIFSDMKEIDAMVCINKLMQSESYATMDVCSFDRYQKTVTIYKSAASPTYLIRNKELYAINGHSLPLGIVAHVDVDHIKVNIEKGDWFLMSSDGVFVDEIYSWIHGLQNQSAKAEVERFIEILKQQHRNDDATVLLAKVNNE